MFEIQNRSSPLNFNNITKSPINSEKSKRWIRPLFVCFFLVFFGPEIYLFIVQMSHFWFIPFYFPLQNANILCKWCQQLTVNSVANSKSKLNRRHNDKSFIHVHSVKKNLNVTFDRTFVQHRTHTHTIKRNNAPKPKRKKSKILFRSLESMWDWNVTENVRAICIFL